MTVSGSGCDGFSCTRSSATQVMYACVAASRGRRRASGGPGIKNTEGIRNEIQAILAACSREEDRNMLQFAPAGLRNIDLRLGALDALHAQQAYTGGELGLVFVNPATRRQWEGDKPIYKRWKTIICLAGVRYRNPYQTRHFFASNLLMLGANPLYVASQMGHADTTLVMRTYGKWFTAGLDDDRRQRLLRLYRQSNPKRADEFPNSMVSNILTSRQKFCPENKKTDVGRFNFW